MRRVEVRERSAFEGGEAMGGSIWKRGVVKKRLAVREAIMETCSTTGSIWKREAAFFVIK